MKKTKIRQQSILTFALKMSPAITWKPLTAVVKLYSELSSRAPAILELILAYTALRVHSVK